MIILITVFSGCKKKESPPVTVVPPPVSYIKNIRVYDTTGVMRYVQSLEYDSIHRLKKMSVIELGTVPDSILLTYTLTYSGSRVFLRETISTSSTYSFRITYYLNASGLADSSIYVSSASPADSTYERYVYTYNTDDQLSAKGLKSSDSISGTILYHYSNGNADYVTAVPSHQNSKVLFSYVAGHYNTIGNENAGMGFLGKSCSNPLMSARIDGMTVDMASYMYEYDTSGRIIHMNVNGNSIMPGVDFFSVPVIMQHQVMIYTYY
jgi:hypothetical protein